MTQASILPFKHWQRIDESWINESHGFLGKLQQTMPKIQNQDRSSTVCFMGLSRWSSNFTRLWLCCVRWEQRQHYASNLGRFCQSCERGGGNGCVAFSITHDLMTCRILDRCSWLGCSKTLPNITLKVSPTVCRLPQKCQANGWRCALRGGVWLLRSKCYWCSQCFILLCKV